MEATPPFQSAWYSKPKLTKELSPCFFEEILNVRQKTDWHASIQQLSQTSYGRRGAN